MFTLVSLKLGFAEGSEEGFMRERATARYRPYGSV